MPESSSSKLLTSSSILSDAASNISCACSSLTWKKASPILYLLCGTLASGILTCYSSDLWGLVSYGTVSSSSASSNSVVTSSISSFSFYSGNKVSALKLCMGRAWPFASGGKGGVEKGQGTRTALALSSSSNTCSRELRRLNLLILS